MSGRDANQPCVCDDLPHHPRSDCPIHGGVWKGEWHGQTVSSVERDANQLAADVREAVGRLNVYCPNRVVGVEQTAKAVAALDELVGLVGTLQQRLDSALLEIDETGECVRLCAPEAQQRVADLEAQVGTLQQERNDAREAERAEWNTLYGQLLNEKRDVDAALSVAQQVNNRTVEDLAAAKARAVSAEARLGEEHIEKMNYMRWYYAAVDERNAAHRECARLQQALREAVDWMDDATAYIDPVVGSDHKVMQEYKRIRSEALAGPDTPADSQEDKT